MIIIIIIINIITITTTSVIMVRINLLSLHYVTGTLLCALQLLFHLIFTKPYKLFAIIFSTFYRERNQDEESLHDVPKDTGRVIELGLESRFA